MLGMEALNMMFAAGLGGFMGGSMCVIALKQNHKYNIRMLEEYWNQDIKRLQERIDDLESKISTISVSKPVGNAPDMRRGKGYNQTRHFNQRG